jgi:hypothetical protein
MATVQVREVTESAESAFRENFDAFYQRELDSVVGLA